MLKIKLNIHTLLRGGMLELVYFCTKDCIKFLPLFVRRVVFVFIFLTYTLQKI